MNQFSIAAPGKRMQNACFHALSAPSQRPSRKAKYTRHTLSPLDLEERSTATPTRKSLPEQLEILQPNTTPVSMAGTRAASTLQPAQNVSDIHTP